MKKQATSSRLRADVTTNDDNEPVEVSLTATAGQLNLEKTRELVDLLRKSFLYQLPRPVFVSADADDPTHLIVRMKHTGYERMMDLITEAGGWDLPADKKAELMRAVLRT